MQVWFFSWLLVIMVYFLSPKSLLWVRFVFVCSSAKLIPRKRGNHGLRKTPLRRRPFIYLINYLTFSSVFFLILPRAIPTLLEDFLPPSHNNNQLKPSPASSEADESSRMLFFNCLFIKHQRRQCSALGGQRYLPPFRTTWTHMTSDWLADSDETEYTLSLRFFPRVTRCCGVTRIQTHDLPVTGPNASLLRF